MTYCVINFPNKFLNGTFFLKEGERDEDRKTCKNIGTD